MAPYSIEDAGRWTKLVRPVDSSGRLPNGLNGDKPALETLAWILLRRYGVVFRRLLEQEELPAWRDLLRVYRKLEARGEIRGGRFVGGFSGEQFALPEAVGLLRAIRRQQPTGMLVSVSAADPLNLVGIVTPGSRVLRVAANRVLYSDGVPVAIREAGRGALPRRPTVRNPLGNPQRAHPPARSRHNFAPTSASQHRDCIILAGYG